MQRTECRAPAYLSPPPGDYCGFAHLPDELLVSIFQTCVLQDLCRAQLVCRRWKEIAGEEPVLKFRATIFEKSPKSITLPPNVGYFEGMLIINQLAKRKPKTTVEALTLCGPRHAEEQCGERGACIPVSVMSLCLERCPITKELLTSLPGPFRAHSRGTRPKGRLHCLHLKQCYGITKEALKALPPHLESLEIQDSTLTDPDALGGINFSPLHGSRTLRITGNGISSENFKALSSSWYRIILDRRDDLSQETLGSLPSLVRLVLVECDLQDAGLNALFSQLYALQLVKCRKIELALPHLPSSLCQLDIDLLDDLSEESLRKLLPSLEVIQLFHSPSNHRLTIYQSGAYGRIHGGMVPGNCTRLRIQNCPELVRADLERIPRSVKQLTIWNCPNIAEEDLEDLPESINATLI